MPVQQCVCYPMLGSTGLPLDRLFHEVAQIGYTGVEMWSADETFEDVVALAKRNHLAVVSVGGHGALGDGLNKAANHDRIEGELRKSIELAAKHGLTGLICFSGNRNPGQSDAEAIEVTANGLRRVAPYAEKYGINLNMELLNSKIDHAGYQCDHTAWGTAVCRLVGSPRVKLLFDIYHMQIMEGDIIRTIRDNIDLIGHFHTAGVPGRADLNDQQELNYGAICRAIAATGYRGYVGHEFRPAGDPIEALRAAFNICKQLAAV
jgi:hydroxypyruvate isomerase